MKWLGSVLLLAGGYGLRRLLLQRYREHLEIGEELCRALDLLQQGIFHLREPLPFLLRRCCRESRLLRPFWEALFTGVEREEIFDTLWTEALTLLPEPYAALWRPLGHALYLGEQEELLILTREETHCVVREDRRQKGEREKLVTALCLSGSLLLIVVFV